jgi:hypothetical protein
VLLGASTTETVERLPTPLHERSSVARPRRRR